MSLADEIPEIIVETIPEKKEMGVTMDLPQLQEKLRLVNLNI